MSRNLQSQTKLTEFAPLSPEEEDGSGFGNLFYWFFKKTQIGPDVESKPSNVEVHPADVAQGNYQWQNNEYPKENVSDTASALVKGFHLDVSEGRSLPNVLKRISNLLALKNTERRSYNDTELKQYWMPDSVSKECYDCGERFTTFRRRHHCRVCGQIFCAKCCSQEIPGKIINCTGDLRVCMYCGKVVLSYVQSGGDVGGGVVADLRALHEDLLSKFGEAQLVTPPSPIAPLDDLPKRKPSIGYQEERFALARNEGRIYLRGLIEEAVGSGGVAVATHRHRLRSHHASFQGGQLIDWLVNCSKASSRNQAVCMGQAMLDFGYIEGVDGASEFLDGGALYRVIQADLKQDEEAKHDSSAESESEFVNSDTNFPTSNSIFNLNLNIEDRTAHLSKPPSEIEEEKKSAPISDQKSSYDLLSENGVKAFVEAISNSDKIHLKTVIWSEVEPKYLIEGSPQMRALVTLRSAFEQHCNTLLRQLLNTEGLSHLWTEVIATITYSVADLVRPDNSHHEEMDIRQYVQFKKVPGGDRSESEIINGVVCSKNLVHRKMPSRIVNPKILLLNCPIVYQRVEGKFLSLEPVIMQESDYIGHAVARIAALHPDLVLVGRAVSRLAQESLFALDISLALNIKQSALERISRSTGADILSSVDARLGKPRLGTCRLFHLRSFATDIGSVKTLMVFEGCPESSLGCTVLLRGGSGVFELSKVKRVAQMIAFARYNARLEMSYLMDASASPPLPSTPEGPFFNEEESDLNHHVDPKVLFFSPVLISP